MDDLVTWLRAQLDEDERVAQQSASVCDGAEWYAAELDAVGHRRVGIALRSYGVTASIRGADAVHIARHDPGRVLREVAAKRALMREMESVPGVIFACDDECECGPGLPGRTCRMVRHLAAVYADRSGYRPEWAPGPSG